MANYREALRAKGKCIENRWCKIMFCHSCGKELVENAKFCMFCGAKVEMLSHNEYVNGAKISELSETERSKIDFQHSEYRRSMSNSISDLCNNEIFNDLRSKLTMEINENLELLKRYLEDKNCWCGEILVGKLKDPKTTEYIKKAQAAYANYLDETPLFIYAFSGGKDGLLITNKTVYGHYLSDINIKLEDIKNINLVDDRLVIEDSKIVVCRGIIPNNSLFLCAIRFIIHMVNIINYFGTKSEASLMNTIEIFNKAHGEKSESTEANKLQQPNTDKLTDKQIINENEFKNEEEKKGRMLDIAKLVHNKFFDRFKKYSQYDNYFFSAVDINDKNAKKAGMALGTYVQEMEDNEVPLMFYDHTMTQSGKAGFVLTNKYLHYCNNKNSGRVALPDIKAVSFKVTGLLPSILINNSIVIPTKLIGIDATHELIDMFFELKKYIQNNM